MSDRDYQSDHEEESDNHNNYQQHQQTEYQKEQESNYPTLQTPTKQINLIDIYQTYPKQEQKEILSPDDVHMNKTDNPLLYDLDTLDINMNDSNNTNLLDIATKDNTLQTIKFLQGRQILIDDEMQVISQGYVTSYKLYTIYSKSKFDSSKTEVKRRFSDFEFLQQQLFQLYPGHIIPILPEKNFWASLNMEGKQYSQQRIKRLKKYLDSLLMNEKLRLQPQLKIFLFDDSAQFSQIKGEFEQKSKFEDKVKTVAGRVFEMGKGFISSFVSKKNTNQIKSTWIQYISRDNLQVTELCMKLKILYDSIFKIKPQIIAKIQQCDLLIQLKQFITVNQKSIAYKDELLSVFFNAQYYIESCWQTLNRYGKLYEQLVILKKQQQGMYKKYKDNPRAKQMDLLKTKIKRLTERLQKSNIILQQQIKKGVLRAEFLFKQLLENYLNYRKIQYK